MQRRCAPGIEDVIGRSAGCGTFRKQDLQKKIPQQSLSRTLSLRSPPSIVMKSRSRPDSLVRPSSALKSKTANGPPLNLQKRLASRREAPHVPVFVPSDLLNAFSQWRETVADNSQRTKELLDSGAKQRKYRSQSALAVRRSIDSAMMSRPVSPARSEASPPKKHSIGEIPALLSVSETSIADLRLLKAESEAPTASYSKKLVDFVDKRKFKSSQFISFDGPRSRGKVDPVALVSAKSKQLQARFQRSPEVIAAAAPEARPSTGDRRKRSPESSPIKRVASPSEDPISVSSQYERWRDEYEVEKDRQRAIRKAKDARVLELVRQHRRSSLPQSTANNIGPLLLMLTDSHLHSQAPPSRSILRPLSPPLNLSAVSLDESMRQQSLRACHDDSDLRLRSDSAASTHRSAHFSLPEDKGDGKPYSILTYGFMQNEFGVLKQKSGSASRPSSSQSRASSRRNSRPTTAMSSASGRPGTARSRPSTAMSSSHIDDDGEWAEQDMDVYDERLDQEVCSVITSLREEEVKTRLLPVQNVPLLFQNKKEALTIDTNLRDAASKVIPAEAARPSSALSMSGIRKVTLSPVLPERESDRKGVNFNIRKRPATAALFPTRRSPDSIRSYSPSFADDAGVQGSPVSGWKH
eukprot:ANDGO_05614.mRNA.1 hypothetical protein